MALAVWLACLTILGRAGGALGAGDRYNVPVWVARHLARNWLDGPARVMGGGFSPATDTEVGDFFGWTSAISAAERDLAYAEAVDRPVAAAEHVFADRLAATRAIRSPVQLRLSSELAAVVQERGLTSSVPLFSGAGFVWPPVNFAYDLPPYVVIRSPRDRIELESTTLLRSDLSTTQIRRIASEAESGGYAAVVVRVGGIATYPSVIEEDDNYADGVELIAHEWTHHYLTFHPLGVRYFQSPTMVTINETVANIVGRELALAMRARFPLPATTAHAVPAAPAPDRSVSFDRTMHQLRLDVDSLLAQGRVTEAEQRMDETRRFLVDHGYYVPTINQAYFAFYGTYANTAASTSPVGPQLATLRSRFSSLSAFVQAVQNVESVEDLSRLLSASGG